ncbi:MAG: HAD family hydrolase [Sphingobium sp.]
MTQIPFDIIGFDLDGTLIDSSVDLAAAVNHALGSVGLPPHEVDEIKRYVGKGTRVMLERALRTVGEYTPERLDELTPILMRWYQEHLCDHTRLYPGAMAAMEELRARGKRLAICTNKSERFTLPIVAALGLDHLFDAVISGDTVGHAKPHRAPLDEMARRAGGGACVFLGDTSNDIDGARGAEMASIAVSFGFVDAAGELGADAVIDHFDELVPLLQNWKN